LPWLAPDSKDQQKARFQQEIGTSTREQQSMRLRPSLLFLCVLLAATTAAGSEFHFAARVDLMPWMTIRTDASGAAAGARPAVSVDPSQDRCLAVAVRIGPSATPARNPLETALERVSVRRTTTAVEAIEVVEGTVRILQITLN
jgi:hypothetical protein